MKIFWYYDIDWNNKTLFESINKVHWKKSYLGSFTLGIYINFLFIGTALSTNTEYRNGFIVFISADKHLKLFFLHKIISKIIFANMWRYNGGEEYHLSVTNDDIGGLRIKEPRLMRYVIN